MLPTLALCALASLTFSVPVHAQLEQLTPEQRRMVEQLPAAQRQEVMRRLQQERGRETRAERPEFPDLIDADRDRDTRDHAMEDTRERERMREEAERKRRIQAGDTLVIRFERDLAQLRVPTDDERDRAERVAKRLDESNPFLLDDQGRLSLPGVGLIELAGLTVEQAVIRLRAEEDLRDVAVRITKLPLQPVGIAGLKPFGYELFEGTPSTFAPVSDIPVPVEYVLGPGDVLRAQLFGNRSADYELPVSRDLIVQFPELGPVSVAGMTFDQVREELRQRVSEQFIGTRLSLTLGDLRSIRIFVLGDVRRPGSYTVSSLATMLNALFYSGGVEERGTLRNIELKRNGETVQRLDLYDLLLRGDTRNDVRLRPGDVIFVPPVGPRVVVGGEVRRPAIYELRGETTAEQALALAGGLEARAQVNAARIERLDPGGARLIEMLDLGAREGLSLRLRDGDVLRVPAGTRQLEGAVALHGHVQRTGEFEWREGLRITDLLETSRDLRPGADLRYVLVRRETQANARIEVFSIDLESAWADPRSPHANPPLAARDQIHVFDLSVGRDHVTRGLITELEQQTDASRPLPVAQVSGRVKAPGRYPLEPGMGALDLLRAGGGLDDAAFVREAELVRYRVVGGEAREAELINVDLVGIIAGAVPDVRLEPYDVLTIREVSGWREDQSVVLRGEVRFPGTYTFTAGETLSSVLERAGGLTNLGSASAAVFTRETLRQREREQLQVLAARIESDLASLSLTEGADVEALSTGQALLRQIRSVEPTGRLVIDLRQVMAGNASRDIELRPGDRLLVPQRSQEVTVLGEVQYTTSHFHEPGLDRDGYIQRSGGT
ncbi:MAG: SLBB domain-containing protein, partial [Gammaproteobacteria bacterium]|nr:SLBB domain-containing protein [Gammaproteobacteria bacterium]